MRPNADALALVRRRHPEWREHHQRWRWLLDSFEGGERYRRAIYGYDSRGLPIRNLVRHKREYPDPRDRGPSDMGLGAGFMGTTGPTPSTDDDYELRRARTPVPTFVAEAVNTHLSRIYSREVKRVGPDPLAHWWSNVDGRGTTIDQWMAETVAPLLLTLGQLDLVMDHPPAASDAVIETQADVQRLGLDRCVASTILPEDMLWWRLDPSGHRYEECLVQEWTRTDDGPVPCYRHWDAERSVLYDAEGAVVSVNEHPYGCVPIVRLFDGRKFRCENVGQSRYEGVAERQREYYNRDSELILSDTTQAHPLLQGPEDYVQEDGTIPIGPSWLLPKKRNATGSSVSYEGFDVVDFPKDGAESIRRNKADLREDIDRDSALVRPAGRDVAAQSGLAKAIDHADGNNRLAKVAKMLARAEQVAAELALRVLFDGKPTNQDDPPVEVTYPTEFDLYTASDVAGAIGDFQSLAANAGTLPQIEGLMLGRLLRLCLPGLSDTQYAFCDQEIDRFLAQRRGREGERARGEAEPHPGDWRE